MVVAITRKYPAATTTVWGLYKLQLLEACFAKELVAVGGHSPATGA
jgi:hypothetical protein